MLFIPYTTTTVVTVGPVYGCKYQHPYFRINVRGRFIYYPSRFKDGVPISPDDPHIIQTALPDGTIKLTIEKVTPADCGAYKLVISNPYGDNSALCAVAVNREYKPYNLLNYKRIATKS